MSQIGIRPIHLATDDPSLRREAHPIIQQIGDYVFPQDRNALFNKTDVDGLGAFEDSTGHGSLAGVSLMRYLHSPTVGEPRATIVALAVSRVLQGAGIGSELLRETESTIIKEGLSLVTITPDEDSPRPGDLVRFFADRDYRITKSGLFVKRLTD